MIGNWKPGRSAVLALVAVVSLAIASGCGNGHGGVGGTRRLGPAPNVATPELVFAATGAGIDGFAVDASSGALTRVPNSPFAAGAQPMWVAADPKGQFLYSTNAVAGSPNVLTFSIVAGTGALDLVSRTTFPGTPGFIAVDASGRNAYVTSLGASGQRLVAAYSIDPATRALSMLPNFPISTLVFPQGIAVDPLGRFVYVLGPAQVDVFARDDATGAITRVAGSPFLFAALGGQSFGLAVVPSGAFVLVPDFNANGVDVAAVNAATGALTLVAGSPFVSGQAPTSVAVDPAGQFVFVANQGAPAAIGAAPVNGSVSSFTIDAGGVLAPTGSPVTAGVQPSAVVVDPAARFVYVGNLGSASINAYSINSSGVLTPLAPSPAVITGGVHALAVTPALTPAP
jgi:6-phosphogluconolactonase (cycloisomerase 2 family)